MNFASGKVSVSVVAGSSTPQWIYDASYSVTGSNLGSRRAMTAILIFFYVVMAGFWQTESLDGFFRYTLSAAVALRGATQEYSARVIRERAVPPERAAVYTGIKAWPSSPWPAAFQAPNRSVQEKSLLKTESLKIIREWN
jgi:hypothetical protein